MLTPAEEIPHPNKEKYNDVPDINLHLQKAVKKDFKDNEYISKRGFYIYKASLEALANLGRTILPMLANGFNTVGVVGLFVLAYNLKIPHTEGSGDVFEDLDPEFTICDVDGDTIVSVQYSGRPPTTAYPATQHIIDEAIYYCYIAATTLRLFTKSVDNYINAWTNIVSKFDGFYGFVPPIMLLPPSKEAITGLHGAFSFDARMKMTLYKILYSAKKNDRLDGLRRFSYEMHLTNTGLHAVGIFAQLCATLNVESEQLLQVLYTQMFEKQINSLGDMMRMMKNDTPEYEKRIWRFGRIFDEKFMSNLQTKACPTFVYILASMLKAKDPAKCKDILSITHLNSLCPEIKLKCEAVGKNVLNQLSSTTDQNPAN